MDQKIIDLFKNYKNSRLDRREFLKKLTKIAGGVTAAIALLPILETNVNAEIIPKNDPDLNVKNIKYPGETGDVKAYLAHPKEGKKFPGIIVIHENRGLNPHIEDVARRIAKEGFITIAPDALSPSGGTPKDTNEARLQMRKLDRSSTTKNFVAAVKYLKTHPLSTGKVGCTGFCWGGAMTNQVAVNSPELTAAVPFYGRQPEAKDVAKIKAALICHYGSLDKRINAGIEAFETALKEASIEYEIYIYKGAAHAFFNDTSTKRYHKEASKLAWERTIKFFKKKLKT